MPQLTTMLQSINHGLLAADRTPLVWQSWLPAQPRAAVLLLHGYSEYGGRYHHVIQAFAAQGYAVVAPDLRGHGRSGGIRADVPRFDLFADDVAQIRQAAALEIGDLPCFVVAHSMGGLVALQYALAHQATLAGLVVSSAALDIGAGVSPWLRRASRVVARLAPQRPVLPSSTELLLSRDPDVQRRFDADPLCYHGRVKARMGYQLLLATTALTPRLAELTLPLLVMHGTHDRIAAAVGSERMAAQARSADATLKLWPEALHELFNETNRDEVIAYVLAWLDARTQGTDDGG